MVGEHECGAVGGRNLKKKKLCQLANAPFLGSVAQYTLKT